MLIVDVFHHSALFQTSRLQTPRQCAILFPEPLLIDEQRIALLEAELARVGCLDLCAEGIGHSVQFHGV